MSELMLINPRERTKRRRRRNPETRATRSRAAKKGWGHRRRNPSVRATARRTYHRARSRVAGFAGSHKKLAGVGETFIHGAVGAGGGLALDILMAKVPLPATLKAGIGHTATKAVGAVLLGMLGQRFMSAPMANSLAIGTMSTVLHDAAREMLAPHIAMADLGDAGLGYYSPGYPAGEVQPFALQDAGSMGDTGMYMSEATPEYSELGEYVQ